MAWTFTACEGRIAADELFFAEQNARVARNAEKYYRAIGVIYRPETERWSHYFEASFPDQFDAVVHFDETRALEPLERTAEWERGELAETFPSGL
jgi:erythromycin esterase-like protein